MNPLVLCVLAVTLGAQLHPSCAWVHSFVKWGAWLTPGPQCLHLRGENTFVMAVLWGFNGRGWKGLTRSGRVPDTVTPGSQPKFHL